MGKKAISVAVALSVALSACGTKPATQPAAVNQIYTSKAVFQETCIQTLPETMARYGDQGKASGAESGILLSLVGALVPSLVDKLTGFVASYAAARAKEYSASNSAATSVVLPEHSSRLVGCVIYSAGLYGDQLSRQTETWPAASLDQLGLAEPPHVYAEWVLHYVDQDKRYLAITPTYLDFSKPQSIRTSSAATKTLSFVIELSAPSNGAKGSADVFAAIPQAGSGKADASSEAGSDPAGKKTLASFPLSYGDVVVGSTFRSRALIGMTTPAQFFDKGSRTFNLRVAAVEVEGGGDFLLKFSEFITENKSKIDPKVSAAIQKLLGTSTD
ncbi:hypothetical protein [Achromobacter pestifer]|uniref:Lipoprotein n=1 Tax=Achromobacter pestifer TaxID=1353889 RepID=A0A6S6YZP3_9BURK|nr:hypothetical protein [Achromobacter pestifer]CAB3645103.1 hypothetical protein LMG3431_02357 [Achromobacter pestifer]